ncbi:serine hydrolase [Lachnospiraceae bacterium 46-15]
MNGNSKKHENILIAVILLCTCASLVFNVLLVKNALSCRQMLKRAETLAQRAGAVKEAVREKVQKETVKAVQREETEERESLAEETEVTETEELPPLQEPETKSLLELESFLGEAEALGEKWAVSAVNLSDGAVYGHHEDIQMQSASVIKVFIMAAVYDRVCYPENTESAIYVQEEYEGELKTLLTSMITVSDNDAANRLVELLGYGSFQEGQEVVNAFCQENGFGGTFLGRRFLAENPADDNYTTSGDCMKLLRDLYNGSCVCAEASEKMLEMLKNQTLTEKIPSGLPEGTVCANKTGEMPQGYGLGCIENDIAIVYGERRDYILCVLSNDLEGRNEEARKRIAEISGYVYKEFQSP